MTHRDYDWGTDLGELMVCLIHGCFVPCRKGGSELGFGNLCELSGESGAIRAVRAYQNGGADKW